MKFSRVARSVLFLLVTLFFLSQLLPAQEPVRLSLTKMNLTEAQFKSLEKLELKFATDFFNGSAQAIVTPAELELLQERGFTFTLVMQSFSELELFKRALHGEAMTLEPVYHTYPEIMAELGQFVQKYPHLIQLHKIGVTSQEKRDIWAVKISDNVRQEEDEPAILFSGAIHSDELAGVEICMTLISHLLENYAKDATVRRWVDRNEIWLIPVINVDGHFVVTNLDPRWRKNTRDNNQNGILFESGDGIDLNRNFDFNWAHGGASDSLSDRYRGEFPFSESECVAVRDLALAQKFMLAVTYHSAGEVIFYPWDWRGRKAPDDKLLTKIAHGLAGSIRSLKGDTTYAAAYGAGTVGQTYPWLYGMVGTFDFVVETGIDRHIFPPDMLENVVQSNLQGAFFMLNQMEAPGITGHVSDAKSGKPLAAEIWLPDIDTNDIQIRTSDAAFGRFFRRLEPGKYRIIVRKPGYQPVILKNIVVHENGWTELKISLKKQ